MVLPCLPPFLTFCPDFFDFMKFKSLRRDVIQQVKKATARGHSGDFIPCPRPDRFDETGRCNQLLGSVRCVCRVRFNEVSYQSLTGVCSIDPLLLHLQTKFLAAFGRQLVWTAKSWFSLPALDFIAVAVLGALLRLQCQRHQLWTILNAHSANVSLLLYSSRQGPAKLTLLIGHCTNFEQCLPCFHLKKGPQKMLLKKRLDSRMMNVNLSNIMSSQCTVIMFVYFHMLQMVAECHRHCELIASRSGSFRPVKVAVFPRDLPAMGQYT